MMAVPTGQALFQQVGGFRGLFQIRALSRHRRRRAFVAAIWWLRRSEWLVSFRVGVVRAPARALGGLITLNQGEPMTEHRVYVASAASFLPPARSSHASSSGCPAAINWCGGLGAVAMALVLLSFIADTLLRNGCGGSPADWPVARVVALAPKHPAAAAAARRGAGGRRPRDESH
jgi:hypothetical protein